MGYLRIEFHPIGESTQSDSLQLHHLIESRTKQLLQLSFRRNTTDLDFRLVGSVQSELVLTLVLLLGLGDEESIWPIIALSCQDEVGYAKNYQIWWFRSSGAAIDPADDDREFTESEFARLATE